MSSTHADLYAALLEFVIDEGEPELSFDARLARENRWSIGHARRVVTEYRRFLFLAVTADHLVTPSDQVDRAWHLHRTCSPSSWQWLCGQLLTRPLHHGPTVGAAPESGKDHRQYDQTLASYRSAFGHNPPADIWPAAKGRFGGEQAPIRITTRRNRVGRKAPVHGFAVIAATSAVVALAAWCGERNVNPFDLSGGAFLSFLIPVLVCTALVGGIFRYRWGR